ncbi:caspase, EACC1-associated type [Catenulispora subtropica]|uniref:Peptidase C14 caspase catalytic subunit p20 n=1 Tax=Catenulispora subtropica TaxID=450798 RepID=A0ABN2QRN5_9ACTN
MTDAAERDFSRSAAVLVGTSEYEEFDDVPAVRNSLHLMRSVLLRDRCGWPAERVAVFENEHSPGNLPDRLVQLFAEVRDVALFFFVGHGIPDLYDELCLGLVGTTRVSERRATTSLPFSAVRNAFRISRARVKIIILDCCFAGLALEHRGRLGSEAMFEYTAATGAAVLAASSAYATAWYEDGPGVAVPYTHFTRRLADIVDSGTADVEGRLTVAALWHRVTDDLAVAGLPVPTYRIEDGAGRFVFATRPTAVGPSRCVPQEDVATAGGRPAGVDPWDVDALITEFPDVPVSVWGTADRAELVEILIKLGADLRHTDRDQSRRILSRASELVQGLPASLMADLLAEEVRKLSRLVG